MNVNSRRGKNIQSYYEILEKNVRIVAIKL